MVYQDNLTKYVALKALKSKKNEEILDNAMEIFAYIWASVILQSDNDREFIESSVEKLKDIWPAIRFVHGKSRHSQSQGSVERAKQDIQNMLSAWLYENSPKR